MLPLHLATREDASSDSHIIWTMTDDAHNFKTERSEICEYYMAL